MSYNYIQAIEIELKKVYFNFPEIGLYNKYLRYCERKLLGTNETWKESFIKDISTITQSANFSNSGSVGSASGVTVVLNNIVQLKQKLLAIDADLTLLQCKLRVYEFVGTDSDSDYGSKDLMFYGIIDKVTWTDDELKIVANTTKNSRKANLMTVQDGVEIPVTFGRSYPEDEIFFKAVRVNDEEETLKVSSIVTGGTGGVDFFPENLSLFPVVTNSYLSPPVKTYDIRLGYISSGSMPPASFFVDKYIHVREGSGTDQWAKIESCSINGTGNAYITVTLNSYLKTNLMGNWDGDLEDGNQQLINSYVNIVDVDKVYKIDTGFCSGFYDSNGEYQETALDIFLKDDDNVGKQIPHFGCDVNLEDLKNSSISVNLEHFSSDSNEMQSFLALPIENIKLADSSNLTDWSFSSYNKRQDGVFDGSLINPNGTHQTSIDQNVLLDRDLTTSCYIKSTFQVGTTFSHLLHCFTFKLPELPKNFSFSNVYLGINAEISNGVANSEGLKVLRRRYFGTVTSTTNVTAENSATSSLFWDNIPDFYIERSLKNIQFWTSGQNALNVGKYNLIDLNITDQETYEHVWEVLIVFLKSEVTAASTTYNTFLKECFLLIESSASIKKELYV